jgi:putative adhesin
MPTFATPGPIAAIVEVAGSHVRVTASDRTDTVVLVEPVDEASRSDVKVAEKTRVDFAGGQLSVKTTVPGRKGGSVAIAIDLPAGSSLAAYLAHSEVHADGLLGECELHLASGLVRLDRVGGLTANIASGDVAIDHIDGRAAIDGGAFAMRIGEVTGAVRLSNSGGRAWIGHASADLDLSSGGCDFDIDRADGDIVAATASGAIRIGRMTHGRAKLMNGSGNIEVGIDEGAAAHLDVESERGTVRASVVRQGTPDPSDVEVSVHARTRYGDVIIRGAANLNLTGRA